MTRPRFPGKMGKKSLHCLHLLWSDRLLMIMGSLHLALEPSHRPILKDEDIPEAALKRWEAGSCWLLLQAFCEAVSGNYRSYMNRDEYVAFSFIVVWILQSVLWTNVSIMGRKKCTSWRWIYLLTSSDSKSASVPTCIGLTNNLSCVIVNVFAVHFSINSLLTSLGYMAC